MYIVKLLTGSLINTGNFLSQDENEITYFARKQLYENNQNIFLDLEQNMKGILNMEINPTKFLIIHF